MVELLFDFNFVNQEFISLIQKFFSFLINNETDVSLGYFFMSITTYDFFYKLTNKDLIKDEGLPNFSLYGFVIYDHVEHAEFKKNLEDNYKYLDQKSGENFLFFSVIELDEEKEKYFKGKSYYEAYKKLEHDNSGITNPVTVKNSNTLAYTLATHLEIDLKYLPVLVVSKDLAFGHKEVIPVTAENFWDKLSKLDYIATFKLKDIHDDKFKDLLIKHGVIAEDDFNISSPNVKLNKALYDATGCFEIANNNFTAQTHIDYLVDCLNKEILNYKNTDERENLEKSLLKLSSVLAAVSQKNNDQSSVLNFIKDWQNSVTKMYLKSYGAFPKTLEIEDFSPVAINLAKSFENEIILSYYNWLRKVKGVPMPEYYGRLLKGKEVKYDRYDLNRNIKGELIPLELGSSVLCLKKYFEENNILPEYHNIEDFNGSGEYMLKIYFEINNIRNSICHPKNIFTKTDLIELENKISSIYNGPLGLKIRDLKNSLTS
jgi:hypothetical protein